LTGETKPWCLYVHELLIAYTKKKEKKVEVSKYLNTAECLTMQKKEMTKKGNADP
jgi:hypothetical protein